MKYPVSFFGMLAISGAVFFSGCSARLEGTLQQNGSGELKLEAALEPRMTALIRRFQAMGNTPAANANILDGPAIARSMAAAPGIAAASLHNNGSGAIAGTITISQADALLTLPSSAGGSTGAFISYSPDGSLRASLDRNSVPRLLTLFSADLSGYLSALMAPVVTGETLTKEEYLGLVASMYGNQLKDEIAASRIDAVIEFPGLITAIQGGTSQGRQARFSIPLADALVLERPLIYEVRWRR
jgi:hypothetical protein